MFTVCIFVTRKNKRFKQLIAKNQDLCNTVIPDVTIAVNLVKWKIIADNDTSNEPIHQQNEAISKSDFHGINKI